ncbi:MAG: hypothetical protein XD41_1418 [Desulfonauticus sp. 38_4375]|nr:MAG: hypothetical protein XD41_1418 [Desulfonauticus sp. 38_4375]
MEFKFNSIGYIKNRTNNVPRHWSVSDLEGEIVLDSVYQKGIKDINTGDKIVVVFCFHKSSDFTFDKLVQKPPHLKEMKGVFSTCSPYRPNPIGVSVFEVLECQDNVIRVKGIDVYDGTPILDIKPYIACK